MMGTGMMGKGGGQRVRALRLAPMLLGAGVIVGAVGAAIVAVAMLAMAWRAVAALIAVVHGAACLARHGATGFRRVPACADAGPAPAAAQAPASFDQRSRSGALQ